MIGAVSLIMIGLGAVSLTVTSLYVTGARVVKVQFNFFPIIKEHTYVNQSNQIPHIHDPMVYIICLSACYACIAIWIVSTSYMITHRHMH